MAQAGKAYSIDLEQQRHPNTRSVTYRASAGHNARHASPRHATLLHVRGLQLKVPAGRGGGLSAVHDGLASSWPVASHRVFVNSNLFSSIGEEFTLYRALSSQEDCTIKQTKG